MHSEVDVRAKTVQLPWQGWKVASEANNPAERPTDVAIICFFVGA